MKQSNQLAKHTQGPLTLEKVGENEEDASTERYELRSPEGNLIATIHHEWVEWDEFEANARLYQVAPKMYEVLRQVEMMDRFMRAHASRKELEEAYLYLRDKTLQIKEEIDGTKDG